MVAASALSLSSAFKSSVFSESSPVLPYFFSLKILPMEGSSDSQSWKKNHQSDFVLHQFRIRAHLGHLFA